MELAQSQAMPQWLLGHWHIKGGGGPLRASCSVAAAATSAALLHSVSSHRNGSSVAKNYFPFNSSAIRVPMPPIVGVDNSGSATSLTWSMGIDAHMSVAGNDYGVATITELWVFDSFLNVSTNPQNYAPTAKSLSISYNTYPLVRSHLQQHLHT